MTTIKDNKTFQTIVGAATLYLLFVLWRDGWIDWIVGDREPESGYSNTQLWVAVGSALLSFVQFVGIVTIGCVSGILPHVSSVVEFGAKKASEGISYLKAWVSKNKGKPKEENQWDWRPLVVVVLSYMLWSGGQLSSIWEKVQGLIPDQIITDVERPSAAVFFIDDDTVSSEERAIATSLLVSDIFESKGVERRMMSTDQPSGSSEGWLSTIVEKSPSDRSSLVLYYIDGTSKVLDVPDSVEKVKELVGAW